MKRRAGARHRLTGGLRTARTRAVLASMLCAACWLGLAGSTDSGAARPAPTLAMSSTTLSPGSTATLTGVGWAPGTVLQASICGARAISGSADCALSAGTTMAADQNGEIRSPISVVVPPSPCPCVVFVTNPRSNFVERLPVVIAGAPVAPVIPTRPAESHIDVLQATLTGSTNPAQWFGLAAGRTLSITLRNVGNVPTNHLIIYASLDQTPIGSQRLSDLVPRGQRTYLVPVQLPALAVGSVTISGHLYATNGQLSGFHVPESVFPWGLIIVTLIVIQLVLLSIRNIVRRRRERHLLDEAPLPTDEDSALDRLATMSASVGSGAE